MPIPQNAPLINRRLLRDDVYHRLRDAIVDGTFAPGEQLRDVDLAAWLGVSRTPVREALLRLAEAGLVAAQPGRSTTVTSLTERGVREARDVVAAMHQLAVREAVAGLTEADLDTMRAANARFRAAIADADVEAALAADDELHAVPVAVAANRALSTVLDQFTPVLRRAERLRFSSLNASASADRHDELIRACAERDVARAERIAFGTWSTLPPVE
ncbi:GntR family transcriptional regulator [Myceligenerans xiligouense]|uniref:DNA-binding GntR family transcriptional regulator n=1 Tax=Myceligenerans xiligouense TaxID=253184 RepID=A0A3N4YQP9_9MICO|nr:GntR family transcriptional regulator [Myceligenerans xiligouense]RPF21684.1 DNA-binding GntR family transcriptional regulator [Myceligenerans xiligouense]